MIKNIFSFHNLWLLVAILLIVVLGLPRFTELPRLIKLSSQLRSTISREPKLETYTTDMKSYLKVLYLIRRDEPYYPSFGKAIIGDATRNNMPEEVWGWKLPFIFYVWKYLPGPTGINVFIGFIILSGLTFYASYKITEPILGKFAFLSPYCLLGYFILPLTDITLFQVEWWAVCFFILGLNFFLEKRKILAFLLFTMSVFTRELFVFHLVIIAIVSSVGYIQNKKTMNRLLSQLFIFVVPIVLLVLFYVSYHLPQVFSIQTYGPVSSWLREGTIRGWSLVRPTLSYASWNYQLYFLFNFRILLFLSTAGLVMLIFFNKMRSYSLIALCTFLPFFIAIFRFGIQTKWHDYWGIYYIPFALIFCPVGLIIFGRIKK